MFDFFLPIIDKQKERNNFWTIKSKTKYNFEIF
jgi:hypothetical protein